MGCWYETCGISGLPITPNDPTALLLLVPGTDWKGDSPGGFCYPTGQWRPICPPIFGTYDDNTGTIRERIKPAHWDLTVALFADLHVRAAFTDPFFETIERGNMVGKGIYGHDARPSKDFLAHRPNREFPIGQMLVRKDIWDFLLAQSIESYFGLISLKGCREGAREMVSYIIENPPKTERDGFRWSFEVDRYFEYRKPTPFFSALFGPQPIANFYKMRLVLDLVEKDIKPEAALAILDEIGDFAYVHMLLNHLRRAYRPQPGKGSQDIYFDLHEKLAVKVAEVCKAEMADYDQ